MGTNQLLLPGGRQSGDSAIAAATEAGILSTKKGGFVSSEYFLTLPIPSASTGTPMLGPRNPGSPEGFTA